MRCIKGFWIISFLFLLVPGLFGQVDRTDADANYEDENYEVALKQYQKVIKREKDDPELNYRMAVCILNTNSDRTEALPYLFFLDSIKADFPDIGFLMAQAYYYKHDFDKTAELAKAYIASGIHDEQELQKVDRFVEVVNNAKKFVATPLNVRFENLGSNVNSKQDDYIPFITEDELFMVFTSTRKYSRDYQVFIKGIYFSSKENGEWTGAKSAGSKINSDENEEAVGLSKDGSSILVHVDRLSSPHDIFITTKQGTRYTELVELDKQINTKHAEAGASMSKSGDTLYFASNRPGGKGGYDIYRSILLPDGSWGIPQNLGEPVNTAYDENYPYITAEGSTLYFSSTGHNTIGGYDVFKTKLSGSVYSTPVNLGYPLNDTYDNFNIALTSNTRYGYLSKFSNDGEGGLDIYRVVLLDVPPTNIIYTGKVMAGDSTDLQPAISLFPDITLNVYKAGESAPIATSAINPKNGKYTFALPPGKYEMKIDGTGMEMVSENIVILDEQPVDVIHQKNYYIRKKDN